MRKIRNVILLLAAVSIIVVVVVVVARPFGGESAPEGSSQIADGPLAPELAGIVAWINSEPLAIGGLKGKVVLVDFWTYTCVNCIRTLPYLRIWHAKYADDGLVILGVHSPEFEIEKKPENVQRAVEDNAIGWPVALDNDYATWEAYGNRYWPSKYLIDKDGVIRYTHFGEGRYGATELEIRKLLEEAGADLSQLDPDLPTDQSYDRAYISAGGSQLTRELYAGWDRGYLDLLYGQGGYIGHSEYYSGIRGTGSGREAPTRDTVLTYRDPSQHQKHLIYLQGPWHGGRESLRHAQETSNFEDYMRLIFAAKSVNAVISPEGPEGEGAGPFKVLVTLDDEYLTDANKGGDVTIEEDGRSFLHVNEPRLYSVVQAPSYGTYDLKLSSNSPHFAIFRVYFRRVRVGSVMRMFLKSRLLPDWQGEGEYRALPSVIP